MVDVVQSWWVVVGAYIQKAGDTGDWKPQIIFTYLEKVRHRTQNHNYNFFWLIFQWPKSRKRQQIVFWLYGRGCFIMAMSGELDEDNDDFDGISDQIRCKVNLIGEGEGREGRNIDQSYLLSFSPIIMPGPI